MYIDIICSKAYNLKFKDLELGEAFYIRENSHILNSCRFIKIPTKMICEKDRDIFKVQRKVNACDLVGGGLVYVNDDVVVAPLECLGFEERSP